MRKLGTTQEQLLNALVRHGYWYGTGFGCGWNWGSVSETTKILDSLVQRGLVETKLTDINGKERLVYSPTAIGRQQTTTGEE